MILYLHLLRCIWLLLLLLLLLLPITLADSTPYQPSDHHLITCGSRTSSQLPSSDGGSWRSEEEYLTSTTTATAIVSTTAADKLPYYSARIFWAPLTYSFPLSSPGPKLPRLYFTDTTYNNTDSKQLFLSLDSNGFNLLHNFSPYLADANAKANKNTNAPVAEAQLVREFYVTESKADKPLHPT